MSEMIDTELEPIYKPSDHDLEMELDELYGTEPEDDWDTPLTEEWLRSVGALPKGDTPGEFGQSIWAKGETERAGDCKEPAMQVVWSQDREFGNALWLESYGAGGETLCIVELNIESTRGAYRSLFQSLGNPLREPE